MTKTMTIRLDENDKRNFEFFCDSIGITASAAVNMFVKATLKEGKIPFELKSDPFYSKENQERLKRNIEIMEKTGDSNRDINLDD